MLNEMNEYIIALDFDVIGAVYLYYVTGFHCTRNKIYVCTYILLLNIAKLSYARHYVHIYICTY